MKLKDWSESKVKSGWIFTGKTDFDKGRKYKGIDVSIYKKEWFRNEEGSVVVKINCKENHDNDEFYKFNNEKEALKFAEKYMRDYDKQKH